MKTMIKTIAQYIAANIARLAWWESKGKTVARHIVKTVFKAGSTVWEITAKVMGNEVVKKTVAIQGLLFNF